MKSLLCVSVLLLVGGVLGAPDHLPPEFQEFFKKVQATCVAEHNVDPAKLEEAQKTMIIPDDHNFKCYTKCVMVHMKMMTDDGMFNEDTAIEHIPHQLKLLRAVDIIHQCKHVKGSDPCDTAFHLVTCFAKASQAMREAFVR